MIMITLTRPSKDVPWYKNSSDEAIAAHATMVKARAAAEGFISANTVIGDELSVTYRMKWESAAARKAFDDGGYSDKVAAYNESVGITGTKLSGVDAKTQLASLRALKVAKKAAKAAK